RSTPRATPSSSHSTAAAEAQARLAKGPIRVRVGLHTGAPARTEEGYVGLRVHLGGRIAAAGHGGQVLLSKATRELLDCAIRDLGEHRVKDFDEPVWIFQLGDETFPPLKTISNTNLPRPASSFVGRNARSARSRRCCTRAHGSSRSRAPADPGRPGWRSRPPGSSSASFVTVCSGSGSRPSTTLLW